MPAVKQKIPGNASSILFLTFGMIGLIPSAIVSVVFLCLFLAGAVFQSIPFLLTGIFSAMTALGAHIRRRVKRFRRYQRVLYGSRYYSMEHLAAATGESRKFVVRDVRKMIRKGMFSDAYLDDKATCLMLDRETYSQYLQTRQNLEQRRMEEKQAEASPKPAGDPKPKDAAAAAVEEGREYIRKIKAANDAIPDQEISQKLFRLEEITGKVFAYVEQHPNKISEIRKFMNYYLPTTLKLVNAYCEFDRQPVEGQNIAGTKQEIRDILDTINTAFENLLDGLFADDAMDISTDISALEIMLAQDGLTGRDFKVEK